MSGDEMRQRKRPTMSIADAHLPDDLWIAIFNKVSPVKPLCRLRCVCKSWNSLISSLSFITAHFDHNRTPFYLPFDSFPFRNRHHSYLPPTNNSPPEPMELNFAGVIRGVVCLTPSFQDPSSPILLWNPTLHKYVTIPESPIQLRLIECYRRPHLGFGFYPCTNDFKIVRFWLACDTSESQRSLPMLPEVFSLQTRLWREAAASAVTPPGRVVSEANCYFMNGAIHWVVYAYSSGRKVYRLVRFDCEREEFDITMLPRAIDNLMYRTFKLEVFNGMLSILVDDHMSMVRWVMEEYGVASSWKQWNGSVSLDEYVKLDCFLMVSEESMFLMDAKMQAVSYVEKLAPGKAYYKINGKAYDHILI